MSSPDLNPISTTTVKVDITRTDDIAISIGTPPNKNWLKVKSIALAILSYVPITGTVIGSIHAYDLSNGDPSFPPSKWEIAQTLTQIFSFLLVPQVIYFSAVGINALYEQYQKSKVNYKIES